MYSDKQVSVGGSSNSRLIVEIVILCLVNLGFYFLFSRYDMLEKLYIYSREHEAYEIDEILPLLLTVSISLLVFAWLRRRESSKFKDLASELSVRDEATGLFNRKYFLDLTATELKRRLRNSSEISLVLLKFDNFEEFDSTLNKVTAEQALADVIRIIRASSREIDIVARWHEDDIIILCRDTKLAGATILAEKILDNFHEFKFSELGALTASIGVVSAVDDKHPRDFIARAEANVENAVNRGKNQIISSNA